MGRTLPESVYVSNIKDKKLHIKNFLLNYKKLVNLERLKNDKDSYLKELGFIDKKFPKSIINYPAILFLYHKNISKTLFLIYASKFSKIKSFYMCSINTLIDIFWGNMRIENPNISLEDIVYSETSIKEDLFFLYADRDSTSLRMNVLASTISYRLDSNPKCRNVVFYRGTVDEMKSKDWSLEIYNSFERNGYKIIDLNSSTSQPKKSLEGVY